MPTRRYFSFRQAPQPRYLYRDGRFSNSVPMGDDGCGGCTAAMGEFTRGVFDDRMNPWATPKYVRDEPDGVSGFTGFGGIDWNSIGTSVLDLASDAMIKKAAEKAGAVNAAATADYSKEVATEILKLSPIKFISAVKPYATRFLASAIALALGKNGPDTLRYWMTTQTALQKAFANVKFSKTINLPIVGSYTFSFDGSKDIVPYLTEAIKIAHLRYWVAMSDLYTNPAFTMSLVPSAIQPARQVVAQDTSLLTAPRTSIIDTTQLKTAAQINASSGSKLPLIAGIAAAALLATRFL